MKIDFEAIGFYRGASSQKWSTPRQGPLAAGTGEILLESGRNFEQALSDLDGFRRIWVLYGFHKNPNWKPMVQPQNLERKVGVFASRAPYRPNAIGMTCAILERIDGLKLEVRESDLLDGTPILDIKPYLPYADAFSSAEAMRADCWWTPAKMYEVSFDEVALEQCCWLAEQADFDLIEPTRAQLNTQPLDHKRKRISLQGEGGVLALRTWRVLYVVDESRCTVTVRRIESGLSSEELQNNQAEWEGEENSLEVHRAFLEHFSN